ncbi:MAG: carbon storage regulator [Pirellulaceae bacterium]|nr:carbon storage regulator [Pirellulaceae bacterium]
MLILSRKASECIHLGDDIVLTIVAVGNDKVRIGVQAPPGVKILRTELEIDATLPMPTPAERPAPLAAVVKQVRRAA